MRPPTSSAPPINQTAVAPQADGRPVPALETELPAPITSVMTQWVARLLLVPTWVIAVGVLVKGYGDTGDGFSAGVIAALGVLLQYVAFGHEEVERRLPVHHAPLIGVVGLFVALAVTFVPPVVGKPLLTHAPAPGTEAAHLGSLELVTAVAFDVGVFFVVFGFCVGAIDLIAHAQRMYRRRPL